MVYFVPVMNFSVSKINFFFISIGKKKNNHCVFFFKSEVNGQRLLGMNHLEVVAILKELPQDVRMVCARIEEEEEPLTEENIRKKLDFELSGTPEVMPSSDRLVKAKSDGSLATSGGGTDDSFSKLKSR